MPDRGEPALRGVQLHGDHGLDVGLQRGVRAHDQLPQRRHQRAVLPRQPGQLRPGDVDQPDLVVGESDALITRAHGASLQAGRDMVAVLLALVLPGIVLRLVTVATSAAVRSPNRASTPSVSDPAAGREVCGVIFDRVMQQRRARHGSVLDPVVVQYPDRHPEQVVHVRPALPPAPGTDRSRY